MATYTITLFSPYDATNLTTPGPAGAFPSTGDEFRLKSDWSNSTDALIMTVTDDDTTLSGDPAETGVEDTSQQTAVVTDPSGSPVASGFAFSEYAFELVGPGNSVVTVYSIYIDDTLVGYGADAPIQPGANYLVTNSYQPNGAAAPSYSSFDAQTYEQAPDNTITGTERQDSLEGGDGNDWINALGGDDTLGGGAGDDTLDGGAGDDQLTGGTGNDSLTGGDGSDTFLVYDGFGSDTIVGGEAGTNSDTIDLSALTTPVTVTYTGDKTGTITDGTSTLSFSEIERIILTEGTDVLRGDSDSAGINIEGLGGNDTIDGGSGTDTIDGGTGNDSIDGNAGDDSLSGGEGADSIFGDTGADTVSGGAGADIIDGDAGADVLDGGSGDDTLDGGGDNDSLIGGAGDDHFFYTTGYGHDTIADFNTGNTGTLNDGIYSNNDNIDLSGYYDDIWELHADQADDGILNQSNATKLNGDAVDYSNNTHFGDGSLTFTGASADNSSFTSENTGVVCFTSGTAIRTPTGPVLIDNLSIGDLVCTMDNGPQPIRWIGRRTVNKAELAAQPDICPILIKRGILGVERDLLVSPQHGMLIDGGKQLARARHLAETTRGIRVARGKRSVTYIHLMFDTHQIIFAEDVPSESFYPGPMALRMLSNAARHEVFTLFPELSRALSKRAVASVYGHSVRGFMARRDVKQNGRCRSERTLFSMQPSHLS